MKFAGPVQTVVLRLSLKDLFHRLYEQMQLERIFLQGHEAEVPVENCSTLVLSIYCGRHRCNAGYMLKGAPHSIHKQEGSPRLT